MKKIIEKIESDFKNEASKLGKNISWFKFAVKTKNSGYRFLKNKDEQWRVLEEITNKLSLKYRLFTKGQIVDLLSDFVNR